jgi:hypothetical protein
MISARTVIDLRGAIKDKSHAESKTLARDYNRSVPPGEQTWTASRARKIPEPRLSESYNQELGSPLVSSRA